MAYQQVILSSSPDLFEQFQPIGTMKINVTVGVASFLDIGGYMDTRHRGLRRLGVATIKKNVMVAFQLTLGVGADTVLTGAWIPGTKVGKNIMGGSGYEHYSGPMRWDITVPVIAGTWCVAVWGRAAAAEGTRLLGNGLAECKGDYNYLSVRDYPQ